MVSILAVAFVLSPSFSFAQVPLVSGETSITLYKGTLTVGFETRSICLGVASTRTDRYAHDPDMSQGVFVYQDVPLYEERDASGKETRCRTTLEHNGSYLKTCGGLFLTEASSLSRGPVFEALERFDPKTGALTRRPVGSYELRPARSCDEKPLAYYKGTLNVPSGPRSICFGLSTAKIDRYPNMDPGEFVYQQIPVFVERTGAGAINVCETTLEHGEDTIKTCSGIYLQGVLSLSHGQAFDPSVRYDPSAKTQQAWPVGGYTVVPADSCEP